MAGSRPIPPALTPADFAQAARRGRRDRDPAGRHRHDAAAAAGRPARGVQGGRHLRRSDVDRRGGAHLQRAAGRGPRRRGGADRRRLTWRDGADALIEHGARGRPRPLSRGPLCSRRQARRRLLALYAFNAEIAVDSRPHPRAAARRDPAAMVARRDRRRRARRPAAIRSPTRCLPRSGRTACRSLPSRLSRGAHLRPLRRPDAVADRPGRLLRRDGVGR